MMTSLSEQRSKFLELVKAGNEFIGTYNLGYGKEHFEPGKRYRLCYDPELDAFRVKTITGHSAGNCATSSVLRWFFSSWWKIDGIFVDEWIEQHSGVDISHEELEDLL